MALVTLSVDARFVLGIRRKVQQVQAALVKSVDEQNSANFRDARKLSETQHISTAGLRAAGHPYSRRHPNPSVFPVMHPFIINRQSGRFYAGWGRTGVSRGRRIISASTFNRVPYARAMSQAGTARMIGRPILEHIAEKNRREFRRRTLLNVRRALRA